jgi:Rps23 Pro-64 3,4-dihydroxylase Tpa1-like proline 4-hydroxylase
MSEPSRAAQVEGHDVFVFDGLVTPEEGSLYYKAITRAAFTRSESARADSLDFKHWACEMPLENLPRTSLWLATEKAIASQRPNERFLPYRCYTNFASFGDVLLTHVDALPNTREMTALWFLCESWETDWGGETLFYDAAGEAQLAVSPKPARLLLFDGAIRHAGKPPNRNCPVGRYTFAIKLRAG